MKNAQWWPFSILSRENGLGSLDIGGFRLLKRDAMYWPADMPW